MKFSTVYPIKNLKDSDFMVGSGFVGKLWFVMNATTVVRFKYYHAWLMGDAICNNSMLGFNGYDQDGKARWDLISNINVFAFEVSWIYLMNINHCAWSEYGSRWLKDQTSLDAFALLRVIHFLKITLSLLHIFFILLKLLSKQLNFSTFKEFYTFCCRNVQKCTKYLYFLHILFIISL